MKNLFRIAMFASIVLSSAPHAARADDAMFQAFGGMPGLTHIVDDFVATVLVDPRIKDFFAKADIPRLKTQLVAQFCQLIGGPCTYTGADMAQAHRGMGVHDVHFNALAEDLQLAMDRAGVPFSKQNYLVARLAPMEKQISVK